MITCQMDLKTAAFNADIEGKIMNGWMGASGKAWSSQGQGTKGTAARNRHTADCNHDIDTSL
jgi:hypothetical protein